MDRHRTTVPTRIFDDVNNSNAPILDGWELIGASDSWVFVSEDRCFVFKTPKAGMEPCVRRGLDVSVALVDSPYVLQPISDKLIDVQGFIGSIWPYINPDDSDGLHEVSSDVMLSDVHERMRALSLFDMQEWDSLRKVALSMSKMPRANFEVFKSFWRPIEAHFRVVSQTVPLVPQHGDYHSGNRIHNLLIDFDDSGMYPEGWDEVGNVFSRAIRFPHLGSANEIISSLTNDEKMLLPIKWGQSVAWRLAMGVEVPWWFDLHEGFTWLY